MRNKTTKYFQNLNFFIKNDGSITFNLKTSTPFNEKLLSSDRLHQQLPPESSETGG